MADKGKSAKKRVDAVLVERGLADCLQTAQALVMAGRVVAGAGEQRIDKPSQLIVEGTPLRVKGDESRFVSRGGDKLFHALEDLGLAEALRGKTVLDVGASTGGFTQCCLSLGATHVVALDVGTGQLAWELRQDPRVTALEKTDVRNFDVSAHPAIDFVVADISFNSLARLAPALRAAAPRPGVRFLMLVKPQFELPREKVPDGGVVIDDAARQMALEKVMKAFRELGFADGTAVDAQVSGRTGNREIFYLVEGP